MCIPKRCWFGQYNRPKRYKMLGEKYSDTCDLYTNGLWLSDELRKGEDSKWVAYLNTMPSRDQYMNYHPAFARDAGVFHLKKCAEKNGFDTTTEEGLEQAVSSGKCLPAYVPEGDQVSYWDSWYEWVRQCHEVYLHEYETGKKREEEELAKLGDNPSKSALKKVYKKLIDTEKLFVVPLNEKGRDKVGDVKSSTPIPFEDAKYGYLASMTRDYSDVGNMPLMDMPNTGVSYNSHQYWYTKSRDLFCLRTEVAVKAGEEITVNYAHETKNPFIMFAQYAFALPKVQAAEGITLCNGMEKPKEGEEGTEKAKSWNRLVEGAKQNGVAGNIHFFADYFCNGEGRRDQEERLLAKRQAAINTRTQAERAAMGEEEEEEDYSESEEAASSENEDHTEDEEEVTTSPVNKNGDQIEDLIEALKQIGESSGHIPPGEAGMKDLSANLESIMKELPEDLQRKIKELDLEKTLRQQAKSYVGTGSSDLEDEDLEDFEEENLATKEVKINRVEEKEEL